MARPVIAVPVATAELSDRELEVLAAWCTQEGTKAAADHLGLSRSTVRSHLSEIREKLGVSTTAAAVYLVRDRLP
jgi:DNA-binding CsgD family transcriptional regulator